MSKNIKETLLGTLVHGEEILENIRVMRNVSKDKISTESVTKASDTLHKKELDLIVSDIKDTKKGAKIIRLASSEGLLPPFEAGQYINIFTEIDGVLTSRPYSISSSPRQRAYYEITVAEIKDGFVSSYLNSKVKIGDSFKARGPAGTFRYNPVFHSYKSLFLAGGSGITPFMSMIREVLEASLSRDIVLIYGVRKEKAALFNEELKEYSKKYKNFTYHLVLSEADSKWKGETGLLSGELIKKLCPDYEDRTAYICGPQVMNEYCQNELKALGMPLKKIRREMFGSEKDITKQAGFPKELTGKEIFKVKIGDKTIDAMSGESLLTSLERAGIRVNVCCRSGECSLCRVKLVSGKVYLAKGILSRAADEKFGYIHSCKAYPVSDIEIIL